ncbi:MAG: hypothetical protein EOO68_20885 [Moraxellaceae bacterium]|nr:MAG: hypothetical protein EOO68_20885 [Moraxellaceae bacterium]
MNQNQIATMASGVISLISTGQAIYKVAANAMDAIEQNGTMSGSDKKTWVLSFVKSVVIDLGENWQTYAKLITEFIDKIKAAYNAVKSLFN